jgi:hypothetical protein
MVRRQGVFELDSLPRLAACADGDFSSHTIPSPSDLTKTMIREHIPRNQMAFATTAVVRGGRVLPGPGEPRRLSAHGPLSGCGGIE